VLLRLDPAKTNSDRGFAHLFSHRTALLLITNSGSHVPTPHPGLCVSAQASCSAIDGTSSRDHTS
jgi:hypothetical protein